jgi:HAD superfamily hydrolase (TIGR01509 family)
MSWRFPLVRGRSAVLYDLDGTLAETDDLHARAWYLALREVTGKRLDRDEYARQVVRGGLTPLEFAASLGGDTRSSVLHRRKETHYERLARQFLETRLGVEELVDAVRAIPLPVGIVSDSSAASIEVYIRVGWPGSRPDVVVSRDDGVDRKPSPAPYSLAVERLGRSAGSCVAIENSPSGIESAKRAGLRCVAIATVDFPAAELAAADAVVPAFASIRVVPHADGAVMLVAPWAP